MGILACSSQTFITPIGRTNTEYFNPNPVYGSNLHAGSVKKNAATTTALSNSDAVILADLVKEFGFYAFDVTDHDHLYDIYRQYCDEKLSNMMILESNNNPNHTTTTATTTTTNTNNDSNNDKSNIVKEFEKECSLEPLISSLFPPAADGVVSVIGKETHFFRYLSTCQDTYVCFDLYGESSSLQNKQMKLVCT